MSNMNVETFIILGLPVEIQYIIHSRPHYIEWSLAERRSQYTEMIEMLLRVHYTQWIEKTILEYEWERSHENVAPDPEMF